MARERSEQEQVRLEKLAGLRESGFNFPNDCKPTATALELLKHEVIEDKESADRFTIAGRMVQNRIMGKAAFAHLLDSSGKVQIYVRKDDVGEESFNTFKHLDIGDILEAKGYLFTTKTGEKTLYCESVRLLTKSLIPLPEKWHGLTDVEARYRQRYVDLIANPDVREVFQTRARIITAVRDFLNQRGFLEVETPVLHYMAGGATAKPFVTHYNALHCDMVMRIALELPLKKLVVGGLERVYEIGRNFRNEGVSKKHNPEFTMLEFYQAYATFEDLMDLTEQMFVEVAQKTLGTLKFSFRDHEIDFTPPWPRISMQDSLHEVGGLSKEFDTGIVEGLQAAAKSLSIELSEPEDWGRSLDELWEELVEPKMIQPTFLTHHPYSISPLARKNVEDPKITDRFEIIIAGMELGNAFSELNDAIDQRERFESQAARKEAGDEEATGVDEDFLRALEYGLPPTAGQGVGIDRLVMLLTNSNSIRDVLLFPQLKPEDWAQPASSTEQEEE